MPASPRAPAHPPAKPKPSRSVRFPLLPYVLRALEGRRRNPVLSPHGYASRILADYSLGQTPPIPILPDRPPPTRALLPPATYLSHYPHETNTHSHTGTESS